MKVYHSIENFKPINNAVVTTGTFDGVHQGHRQILNRLNQLATQHSGESVLLTFHPHPRLVLFPENTDLKLLTTQSEKIELLKNAGLQHLIIHPFTKEFSRLKSLDFIDLILVQKLKTHKLVIGYDHHFGRNREGSFEHLKNYGNTYGFSVEEIAAKDVDNVNISSTKIREALNIGDVNTAQKYLGYHYGVEGEVTHGNGLGKTIGYPTANIFIADSLKLIPAFGVYTVKVILEDKNYFGILNIGKRPTIGQQLNPTIEVHILDFDKNIYGQTIQVKFISKIREEMKFESLDLLKNQIKNDEQKAREILKL